MRDDSTSPQSGKGPDDDNWQPGELPVLPDDPEERMRVIYALAARSVVSAERAAHDVGFLKGVHGKTAMGLDALHRDMNTRFDATLAAIGAVSDLVDPTKRWHRLGAIFGGVVAADVLLRITEVLVLRVGPALHLLTH